MEGRLRARVPRVPVPVPAPPRVPVPAPRRGARRFRIGLARSTLTKYVLFRILFRILVVFRILVGGGGGEEPLRLGEVRLRALRPAVDVEVRLVLLEPFVGDFGGVRHRALPLRFGGGGFRQTARHLLGDALAVARRPRLAHARGIRVFVFVHGRSYVLTCLFDVLTFGRRGGFASLFEDAVRLGDARLLRRRRRRLIARSRAAA